MARKLRSTEAKKTETEAKPKRVHPEYLVVALSGDIRIGSQLRILNVSENEEDARKKLEALSDAGVTRVAVLQKKRVYSRRPAVVVTPLSENIIKA